MTLALAKRAGILDAEALKQIERGALLHDIGKIGILKSLGAANVNIRKVFLYLSAFLVGEGLLWGNLLGILLGLIQHYGEVVHLDPASYYVDTVPVNLAFSHLILLNIGAMLVTLLMLMGPSYLVGRISPEKTIRFE